MADNRRAGPAACESVSGIASLPADLLHDVAKRLPSNSLGPLRASSKDLCQKLDPGLRSLHVNHELLLQELLLGRWHCAADVERREQQQQQSASTDQLTATATGDGDAADGHQEHKTRARAGCGEEPAVADRSRVLHAFTKWPHVVDIKVGTGCNPSLRLLLELLKEGRRTGQDALAFSAVQRIFVAHPQCWGLQAAVAAYRMVAGDLPPERLLSELERLKQLKQQQAQQGKAAAAADTPRGDALCVWHEEQQCLATAVHWLVAHGRPDDAAAVAQAAAPSRLSAEMAVAVAMGQLAQGRVEEAGERLLRMAAGFWGQEPAVWRRALGWAAAGDAGGFDELYDMDSRRREVAIFHATGLGSRADQWRNAMYYARGCMDTTAVELERRARRQQRLAASGAAGQPGVSRLSQSRASASPDEQLALARVLRSLSGSANKFLPNRIGSDAIPTISPASTALLLVQALARMAPAAGSTSAALDAAAGSELSEASDFAETALGAMQHENEEAARLLLRWLALRRGWPAEPSGCRYKCCNNPFAPGDTLPPYASYNAMCGMWTIRGPCATLTGSGDAVDGGWLQQQLLLLAAGGAHALYTWVTAREMCQWELLRHGGAAAIHGLAFQQLPSSGVRWTMQQLLGWSPWQICGGDIQGVLRTTSHSGRLSLLQQALSAATTGGAQERAVKQAQVRRLLLGCLQPPSSATVDALQALAEALQQPDDWACMALLHVAAGRPGKAAEAFQRLRATAGDATETISKCRHVVLLSLIALSQQPLHGCVGQRAADAADSPGGTPLDGLWPFPSLKGDYAAEVLLAASQMGDGQIADTMLQSWLEGAGAHAMCSELLPALARAQSSMQPAAANFAGVMRIAALAVDKLVGAEVAYAHAPCHDTQAEACSAARPLSKCLAALLLKPTGLLDLAGRLYRLVHEMYRLDLPSVREAKSSAAVDCVLACVVDELSESCKQASARRDRNSAGLHAALPVLASMVWEEDAQPPDFARADSEWVVAAAYHITMTTTRLPDLPYQLGAISRDALSTCGRARWLQQLGRAVDLGSYLLRNGGLQQLWELLTVLKGGKREPGPPPELAELYVQAATAHAYMGAVERADELAACSGQAPEVWRRVEAKAEKAFQEVKEAEAALAEEFGGSAAAGIVAVVRHAARRAEWLEAQGSHMARVLSTARHRLDQQQAACCGE